MKTLPLHELWLWWKEAVTSLLQKPVVFVSALVSLRVLVWPECHSTIRRSLDLYLTWTADSGDVSLGPKTLNFRKKTLSSSDLTTRKGPIRGRYGSAGERS